MSLILNLFSIMLLTHTCFQLVSPALFYQDAKGLSSLEPFEEDFLGTFLLQLKRITGSSDCTTFITTANSQGSKQNGTSNLWEYLEGGSRLPTKVILTFDKILLEERKINQKDYPFRYIRACSLVLHSYSDNGKLPENFSKLIPGGIFQSYHLFLKPQESEIRVDLNPTKNQATIKNELEIRHSAIYEFNPRLSVSSISSSIFQTRPNWNLRPVLSSLEYEAGPAHIQFFKENGQWNHYPVATLYYLAKYMNATVAFNSLSGMPIQGQMKTGGWGDFVDPLINGSVQVCTALNPALYPPDLIFFSKPILYTDYVFLTALPRERSLSPIETLINPFSFHIWMGLLLSIAGVFLVLQLSIITSLAYVQYTLEFNVYARRSVEALMAVFGPIIEQPGFGKNLLKIFQNTEAWRIFCLWSLISTIVTNYYKCNVISGFVKPSFSYPPRNFKELMTSNFKINGILFDENLDNVLEQVNDSLSQFLLARTKDTGWPHGQRKCLLEILQWDSVCLGARVILNPTARIYLTNADREPMYLVAEDGILHIEASFGVSRYYPEVLDSLNKIISLLDPSGLYLYWYQNNIEGYTSMGRNMNRMSGPKTATESSGNWRISAFLLEIAIGGYAASGCIFLLEMLYSRSQKHQRKSEITAFVW